MKKLTLTNKNILMSCISAVKILPNMEFFAIFLILKKLSGIKELCKNVIIK